MGINRKYMKFFTGVLFFVLFSNLSAQDYVKVETLSSKKYYIYVIEDGVSLESLATDFKTTKEAILNANPGADKNFTIGRKLMIPVNLREIIHEVKESETLYSLCKKYAVSIEVFKSDSTIVNVFVPEPNAAVLVAEVTEVTPLAVLLQILHSALLAASATRPSYSDALY
jgi:LysM repeat protein